MARTFGFILGIIGSMSLLHAVEGASGRRTPATLVHEFYNAFPTGHVDSGSRSTEQELLTLKRYLSTDLYALVREAVEYRTRWIDAHPDRPGNNGGPPGILKPPFAEGFDFAGCPDGARAFKVEGTEGNANGTWDVRVRFWYDRNLEGWQSIVVVKRELAGYVIDDVLFEPEPNGRRPRLSTALKERWK